MGMFDRIEFNDVKEEFKDVLTSKFDGSFLFKHFQTKSLCKDLTNYIVFRNRLYQVANTVNRYVEYEDAYLPVLTETRDLLETNLTGVANCIVDRDEEVGGLPVLTYSRTSIFSQKVQAQRPFVEFSMKFVNGGLKFIDTIFNPNREEFKKYLVSQGHQVLDDNGEMAQCYLDKEIK